MYKHLNLKEISEALIWGENKFVMEVINIFECYIHEFH